DRQTGKLLHRLKGPTLAVRAVTFSPDGKRLAAACKDRRAYVWDVESGKLTHTLAGHEEPVMDVAFSPDGKRLLTASGDGTLRLWDAASGKEVRRLGASEKGPIAWGSVAFLPDGKAAVAGGSAPLL